MRLYHIREKKIEIVLDEEVDAASIRFSTKRPQGAIEINAGVILHIPEDNQMVALEVLHASECLPIQNLFTLELAK
jgi:hypothetical protein